MEERMLFGSLIVEPVYTEREVNFNVSLGSDYLFRLVPGIDGFELSVMDMALDQEIDYAVVENIGAKIDNYYS